MVFHVRVCVVKRCFSKIYMLLLSKDNMADICNRCGEMIKIPFNKSTEEKLNGRMVTLHLNCNIDNWDVWEQVHLEEISN